MRAFLKSFVYAARGVRRAFADQRNLKIEAGVALVVIAAGIHFSITATEWGIVLLTIAVVIGLEMVNSALEGVVDLVTQEHKPLAGKVKDIAAGAVLFASFIAIVIGVIIFRDYIL